MDNRNYDIAEDKKSEYLFNEIKAGYNSQAFFTEDFTTANNAFTLTFCAVKNSRAQAKVTFTSLGTVKFSINGVPCEERSCSGNTETDLEFFVTKGDNVLSIDISGATNFSLSYVNICGYVKRKPSDSKIYAVNGTGKSLIAKFNAVKNVVDVYVYGGSASIICSDVTCKGVALSDLDQNQVVAAFLKSDKIELYLIDLRYDDIMDSAEIVVSGALRISGGANGTLYVVAGDKSLKKYTVDGQLNVTCAATGKRVNKVICSPQCSFYIIVGLDGKAFLVDEDD